MEFTGRTLACAPSSDSDTQPSGLNSGTKSGYFSVVALQQKCTLQSLLNEQCLFLKTTGCLTASVQKSIQKSIVFHSGWALESGLD